MQLADNEQLGVEFGVLCSAKQVRTAQQAFRIAKFRILG